MTVPTETTFFALNTEFEDFSTLLERKKAYEQHSNTILTIESSHKLKGDHDFSRKYVYERVTFVCKCGTERATQSKGYRQSSTIKKNCPVTIRIGLVTDKLVVKESNLIHANHMTDRTTFDHYPEDLRLTKNEHKRSEALISVDGNKKKVKMALMHDRGGRPVMMKALHNVQTKMNATITAGPGNELQKLYDAVSNMPHFRVRFISNESKEIVGIFLQDDRMEHLYEKYPEIILFDATYKLNKNQMPLFIQCCIDGNGETEIISLYICRSESREGIEPMVDVFKELNANWQQTTVIIGDKDFADRSVYTDKFPNAVLQICMYHVLLAFSREITTQKRGITSAQRAVVLEILMRIVYSRTREAYDLIYAELCALNLEKVLDYYNTCWHSIRDEWTMHGRNQYANYLNATNNRSERLNRTMKQIGNRYANLLVFFENITTSVSVIASEKDIKAVRATMRVQRLRFESEVLRKYNDYLTPFIFKKIQCEIEAADKVPLPHMTCGTFHTSSGHTVTENSCSCMFFTSMQIPCRHIFKLLRIQKKDEFVPLLFAARWTKEYYQKSNPALAAYDELRPHQPVSVRQVRVPDEISKYKQASTITKEINNLAAAMSTGQYTHYLDRLKALQREMSSTGNVEMHNSSNANASLPSSVDVIAGDVPSVLPSVQNVILLPSSVDVRAGAGQSVVPSVQKVNAVLNVAGPSSSIRNGNGLSDRDSLANILLPTKIVNVGRPKGSGNTVIGTKRKVLPKSSTQQANPKRRKFSDLNDNQKAFEVVGWLTNMTRQQIEGKGKISVDDIIQDGNMFNRLRNEEIDLKLIRKLLDCKCYKYLSREVERLVESEYWACVRCKKNLTGLHVMCMGCLDWFHIKCTPITSGTQAKDIDFFCSNCQ